MFYFYLQIINYCIRLVVFIAATTHPFPMGNGADATAFASTLVQKYENFFKKPTFRQKLLTENEGNALMRQLFNDF